MTVTPTPEPATQPSATPALTSASISATIPPPAAGATRTRLADGMVMVYVPAGEFTMGSPDGEGENDEHPQHPVTLDGFWIDRTEMTSAQYRKCIDAGACQGTIRYEDARPIVHVRWDQAQAYCAWVGARLPTEAEWEKAARGTDGRKYPWGNDSPSRGKANYCDGSTDCRWRGLLGADWYLEGASPYGALNMAGNAWEWVADWYDSSYYSRSPSHNPPGPDAGDGRVLRGGSLRDWDIRSAIRYSAPPTDSNDTIGFRCASDPGSGDRLKQPEATLELTATPSASGVSSGAMTYAAPSRLKSASIGDNKFSFNWTWTGSLKENEFFELRIWSGDGPHWGGAEPTKDVTAVVDMSILARGEHVSGPDRFEWRNPVRMDLGTATSFCASVVVITKEPYASLSPESNAACWNWP